jgi:glycosyltransferase involved in cell wall biosynthesis
MTDSALRDSVRFVVPRYGANVIGGAEGVTRLLAQRLARTGWETHAWATRAIDEATWAGSLPPEEVDSGVRVRRFPVARYRHPGRFHETSRVFFRLPRSLRPEGLWVRMQGPFSPALVSALRDGTPLPTVFTPYLYHPTLVGINATPRPRLLQPAAHDEPPLRLRLVRRAVEASDAIWYHSPEERELFERTHPAAALKRNAVGAVGVEPVASGDAQRFRSQFGVHGPFLFFAGRLATGKGREDLVRDFTVLRRLRGDIGLVVAGSGPAHAPVAGLTQIGRIDERTLRDALAAASAVVVPGRLESLSLLALDAWNAGRPCLLNGAAPVLRGQAERSGGALVFTTTMEFVNASRALVDDAALAASLGASGRRYVARNYRWDDVIARLRHLIGPAEG